MLWTAFTLGLLGSLHCIGMCGPIAMSLPMGGTSKWELALNGLIYNGGRILTYVLMGSIFGLLGKGVFLAGYQSALSIVLGVLLIILAFFAIQLESKLLHIPFLQKPLLWLKHKLAVLLRADQHPSFFMIGLLNGLLPCGLVYMAIVGAVATGEVFTGAAYMALFGLGTLPMMLSAIFLGSWMHGRFRTALRRVLPVMLVAMALLLIFRGLHFDLPRGLELWEDMNNVPMCH